MGQAKRKQQEYSRAKSQLLASIDGDTLMVAKASIALFEGFILPKRYTGGCYLATMVLHKFLLEEREIVTDPVVGYVNDGTDEIMISHAWLEFKGLKTDLTLHLTEHVDPGTLLVVDRALRAGEVSYSYHRELTEEGFQQYEKMKLDPQLATILKHKDIEHSEMLERAENYDAMVAYIEAAPLEMSYEAMTRPLQNVM